jgi:hypothetical protein
MNNVQCVRVLDCVQDVAVMKFKSEVLVWGGEYIKRREMEDARASCRNDSE